MTLFGRVDELTYTSAWSSPHFSQRGRIRRASGAGTSGARKQRLAADILGADVVVRPSNLVETAAGNAVQTHRDGVARHPGA